MRKIKPDRVLAHIVKFKKGHDGNSPTYAEMAAAFECSTSVIYNSVLELERAGAIKRTPYGFEIPKAKK